MSPAGERRQGGCFSYLLIIAVVMLLFALSPAACVVYIGKASDRSAPQHRPPVTATIEDAPGH